MMMALEFLFGSGWMIAWHLAIWVGVLLLVVVPMMQLADYIRGGRDPGPASPVMLASVIIPIVFFSLLTMINGFLVSRVVAGPWPAQALAIFAGVTLVAAFPLLPGIVVAGRASRFALALTWLILIGILAGNLLMLFIRARYEPESIPFRPDTPLLLLLGAIALPSVLFLVLTAAGMLTRVRGR